MYILHLRRQPQPRPISQLTPTGAMRPLSLLQTHLFKHTYPDNAEAYYLECDIFCPHPDAGKKKLECSRLWRWPNL
jgi:hypothetical protein